MNPRRRAWPSRVSGALCVLNTYIPQGKEIENPDYPYKLRFIARVRGLLERRCSPDLPVVWVGDLNVAPSDIDVTNPKNKKNHVCFHEDVKKALASAMEWGLVDIFREHLPEAGEYTFWDYRIKGFACAQYRLAHRPCARHEERCGALPLRDRRARTARDGEAVGPHGCRGGVRLRFIKC